MPVCTCHVGNISTPPVNIFGILLSGFLVGVLTSMVGFIFMSKP